MSDDDAEGTREKGTDTVREDDPAPDVGDAAPPDNAPDAREGDDIDEGESPLERPEDSPEPSDSSDPLADLDDADPVEEDPFEEMDIDTVDPDAVLTGDETTEPDDPDADGDVRVIDDRTCHNCEFFADPPDLACTHEGTDIRRVVDTGHYEVVNCPMVLDDVDIADDL